MFFVLAGCMAFSGLVFILLGSSDVQPWAMPQREESPVGRDAVETEEVALQVTESSANLLPPVK